jgi:hypothetical protein
MEIMKEREIWLCSECGHVVRESDEFCVARESIFAETDLAAHSRFRKKNEDDSAALKPVYSHEIRYAFA